MKKVALYDPYLDTLGGGEKHILSIIQVFEEQGYEVSIFWDTNLTQDLQNKLNLTFKKIAFIPEIFPHGGILKKIQELSSFDAFFYVTDGSYFISSSKKNYVFCMVPDKKLYKMSLTNKLKTFNYSFISNSKFTQKWLFKWGIKSDALYPYISDDFFVNSLPKEKQILSVGRFFPHLHSKNHAQIIETFLKFHRLHPDFKLVLAGGMKMDDRPYVDNLLKQVNGNSSISIRVNIPYKELVWLYRKSMFYWHFTGLGVNEQEHPEKTEHLGLTPLEAMASNSLVFCVNKGGPKEIIQDNKTGFLFDTQEELIAKTSALIHNPAQYNEIQKKAYEFARKEFSYSMFKKRVIQYFGI